MCVILVCEGKRPEQDMVEKAWEWNDQGGGVGWIDGKNVRWKKGLTEGQMQDLCKTLPLPYVAHFRISSVGVKTPSLCHPFPIQPDVSTSLEGKTPKGVLFHNGTWTRWKDVSMEACIRKDLLMPEGLWNDTRAMAWMATLYGVPFLDLIDEKTAVVTPNGIEIFGSGWSDEQGVVVSNKIFLNQSRHVQHHGGHFGTALRERLNDKKNENDVKQVSQGTGGSSSLDIPFQRSGDIVLPGEDVEESVQETSQGVSAGNGKGEGSERQTPPLTKVKHPIDIVLERLRTERLGSKSVDLVVMGPAARGRDGIYKTAAEAASAERRERQRRIEGHRRGITYMGDM